MIVLNYRAIMAKSGELEYKEFNAWLEANGIQYNWGEWTYELTDEQAVIAMLCWGPWLQIQK